MRIVKALAVLVLAASLNATEMKPLFDPSMGFDQRGITVIRWVDASGNLVVSFAAPFTVKAGTNVTFTSPRSSYVVITATGGGGDVPCAAMPALTGGVTSSAGSCATTAAVVPASAITGFQHDVVFTISNSSTVIPTGTGAGSETRFAASSPGGTCSVVNWSVNSTDATNAALSGSVVVAIQRAPTGASLTYADMVGGGNAPTLSSASHVEGTAVSGWTSTTITDKDWLRPSITSVTTCTNVTVVLRVTCP